MSCFRKAGKMVFQDLDHDADACMDVWTGFYTRVYPPFFKEYFDFSKIEDKETTKKCKRWYIKLKDDIELKKEFPRFKMSGDCIFNFNEKKVNILSKYINTKEGLELLAYCKAHHHSFENFAFMPITGGMNNQKGRQVLDRPDIHVNEISKYFKNEDSNIFSNARGNRKALEWYLSLFENSITDYFCKVYLIDDEDFIFNCFLPFADIKVCDGNSAIQYMKLAKMFWEKRRENEAFKL